MKASIMLLKIGGGGSIIYVHCLDLLVSNKKSGKKIKRKSGGCQFEDS